MELVRKSIVRICIYQMIGICIICYLFTAFGLSDDVPELIGFMVLVWGSLIILALIKQVCSSKIQYIMLMGGYAVRIACMLVDLYGRAYVSMLHSGTDSEGFYGTAMRYYNGDFSHHYTWYPYIINGIFTIFGLNRMVAQYINILFWVFTAVLILNLCNSFHVSEKNRMIACALLAFLPNSVVLSSVLMRESIMIFLDVWGLCLFLCWMDRGKFVHLICAFLVTIPAIMLHSVSIGVWVVFALILSVWDRRKQRYRISLKTGMILILFILCIGIILFTDLRELFLNKFPSEISLYSITHRPFYTGGSDYLRAMDCQYWYQFIPFTLVRMFYFIFSPILTESRGLNDYLAFLGDVLPIFFVLCSIFIKLKKRANIRYAFVGILIYFVIVGLFAWGTSNAGTAMRHRGLIWGILLAAWCIMCGRRQIKECGNGV